MIIKNCFNNVVRSSMTNGRQVSAWLASKYNSGKVAITANGHLVAPVGSSIYGVLISSDTARHWL